MEMESKNSNVWKKSMAHFFPLNHILCIAYIYCCLLIENLKWNSSVFNSNLNNVDTQFTFCIFIRESKRFNFLHTFDTMLTWLQTLLLLWCCGGGGGKDREPQLLIEPRYQTEITKEKDGGRIKPQSWGSCGGKSWRKKKEICW